VVTQQVTVNGLLYIEDILESGTQGKLKVRLSGELILRRQIQGSGQDSAAEAPLKLSEKIYIERVAAQGVPNGIKISVVNPSLWSQMGQANLIFQRIWNAPDTAAFSAMLETSRLGKTVEALKLAAVECIGAGDLKMDTALERSQVLLRGSQRLNAAVLQTGNAFHDTSLAALKLIGSALQDKTFADDAARLLFPPPKAAPAELKIFAKHDWVLFHRRRELECGYAVTPEEVIQPRRYRVFHGALEQAEEIAKLKEALASNNGIAIAQFGLKPVTVVEFEAGIQSLRTSHTDVLADWQKRVLTDADIAFGAIASCGAALDEGETIATARLDSLADVLVPVTQLADDAELVTLTQVPDLLAGGEVDGAIVLATLEIATTCHQVYRLEITGADLEIFLERLGDSNFADLLKEFKAQVLSPNAVFRSGSNILFGEQAAAQIGQAWNSAGNGTVKQAISIVQIRAFSGQPDSKQLVTGQAARIADVSGSTISSDKVRIVETDITLPQCPIITILVTEPHIELICNEVNYMVLPGKISNELLASIKDMIEHPNQGYQAFFNEVKKRIYFLVSMDFIAGTADAPPQSVKEMIDAWNGLEFTTDTGKLSENMYAQLLLAISPKGANRIQQSAHLRQAQFVREKLSLSSEVNVDHVVNGSPTLPTACEAITLIFLINPISAVVTHMPGIMVKTSSNGESSVAGLASNITFNAEGGVVRDSTFEAALAELKTTGNKLNTIELVTTSDSMPDKEDTRALALLAALKEVGVAETAATIKVRIADSKEGEIIKSRGAGATEGFVFKW
jgi:hypothetical protein